MSFYEKGPVRIHFEEKSSGFPLLMIAGGGLNSTIANLSAPYSPFDAMDEFKSEYRCIGADLRNANGGQSAGPLEIDRTWDSHTDDQLGVLDHLRIDKFMVLGFCIGGPMIWNLLKRAPDRIVAAVLAQPSGSRPEMRDLFYDNNMKGWAPAWPGYHLGRRQDRGRATMRVCRLRRLPRSARGDKIECGHTHRCRLLALCVTPILSGTDIVSLSPSCFMVTPKGSAWLLVDDPPFQDRSRNGRVVIP